MSTAALPASLRRINQRTVVSLLMRMGVASRAEVAKAAGMSQPTAGKIIAELLRRGILELASAASDPVSVISASRSVPRLGRPGQMLKLDGRRNRLIGIELGVSETKVAALPLASPTQDRWTIQFRTPNSAAAWLAALKSAVADMREPGIWCVLVSVPGIVDEMNGRVLYCPNLHWLERTDLPALVRHAWDLPILLVQEIRALALGHLAGNPGKEDFLLIDFGQGVGGAMVTRGKLAAHPLPLCGEIGHTPVPGNLRQCGCGGMGCLETLVSRRGLLASFQESGAARSREGERSWEQLRSVVQIRGLQPWLKSTLELTGGVIAGALNVLGLNQVVITGALQELPPAVMDYLADHIQKGTLWARFGHVTTSATLRHRSAGLVAAGIDRLVLPETE